MVNKSFPLARNLLLTHLAVRYANHRVGCQLLHLLGCVFNISDSVVKIIHLSSAPQLASNGIGDYRFVIFNDICLHRHTVDRRFFE